MRVLRGLRALTATFVVFSAAGAWSEEAWTPLEGAAITVLLIDKTVTYPTATQHFYASGRTSYTHGRESWGYWEVRADQYCSQWPPADGWACYDVLTRPHEVRFVGESGDATDGQLKAGN